MDASINVSPNGESQHDGRMRADVKAQWVAALRSGDAREAGASSAVYRQGKHVLHNVDQDTYCCLGVLCALAVKAGVLGAGTHEYNSAADGDVTVYGAEGDRHGMGGVTLPHEVLDWTGLDDDNPDVYMPGSGESKDLASLNDQGATFLELADLIEQNL